MDPVAACQAFIEGGDARQLAKQLRSDNDLCKVGGRPSFLAVFLPEATTDLANEISKYLPDGDKLHDAPELPVSVRQLWYNGLIDGIRTYLNALSVTAYLELATEVDVHLQFSDAPTASPQGPVPFLRRRQNILCYICRFNNTDPHHLYPSLCETCGSFNLANSLISLPGSLDLWGKTALVTGGRVNLGFSTTLRLLRCGAKVVISTRYPRDAESRYLAESDSSSWRERLRVVGADFRTARDAFNLVSTVKQVVRSWSNTGQLDILINNAAQTLTDPLRAENKAIERERMLEGSTTTTLCVLDDQYKPRLRGGNNTGWQSSLQDQPNALLQNRPQSDVTMDVSFPQSNGSDSDPQALAYRVGSSQEPYKSSWVQSIDEIPYEDLMTAHSVNFFVPLILCRELLPIMGKPQPASQQFDTNDDHESHSAERHETQEGSLNDPAATHKPFGYIINVSSREGIFEDSPRSEAKNGKHVHTNTSKAALNMITETEASTCWRRRRVAMNTVDPGYMSAAPEMQNRGDCPITFEDGAARVLWPIATAEKEGRPLYGKFLKHFGEVKIERGVRYGQ